MSIKQKFYPPIGPILDVDSYKYFNKYENNESYLQTIKLSGTQEIILKIY